MQVAAKIESEEYVKQEYTKSDLFAKLTSKNHMETKLGKPEAPSAFSIKSRGG